MARKHLVFLSQTVREAWAPHVKTAPSHPFTCFLGLTFVHRLLSVVGTSHMGSSQALSYTMKPMHKCFASAFSCG